MYPLPENDKNERCMFVISVFRNWNRFGNFGLKLEETSIWAVDIEIDKGF